VLSLGAASQVSLRILRKSSNSRQTVSMESAYSFLVVQKRRLNREVSYGSNCPHSCNDSHLDSCFLSSKAERLQTEIKSSWSGAGAFLDSITSLGLWLFARKPGQAHSTLQGGVTRCATIQQERRIDAPIQ